MADSINERRLRRSTARAAGRPSRQAIRSRSRKRTTSNGTDATLLLARRRRASVAMSLIAKPAASLRLRELVAKAVHGVQTRIEPVLFFEFHAQAPDVNVDRALVAIEIISPHALEQRVAR